MDRLSELFEEIEDTRESSGKRHCLSHIMVISVVAILCKCVDFEDIRDYAVAKQEWLEEKLGLWDGIPSVSTFRNVFRVVKAEEFLKIFLIWINEVIGEKTGKQIIIDGKAIRAAAEKVTGGNTPYMVSAYLSDIGISIGQLKVEEKSNEITAIPELLKLLDIDGCIITIDAIGTQTEIMDLIIKNKGNFVLPLKANQKGGYSEIKDYYEDALGEIDAIDILHAKKREELLEYTNKYKQKFSIKITRETGHGRKDERIYIKSTEVGWFTNKKWEHVKCVIMVISNSDKHGRSIRYYISSIDLPVEELAQIIRKHWQIENNLHWVLDMYFYEDLSRNRKDNALENLSLLRKFAYNIIKLDNRYDTVNKNGNSVKLSTKRKMNRYNLYPNELEELLFKVIPLLKI